MNKRAAALFVILALLWAVLLAGCTAEDGFSIGSNGLPEVSDPEYVREMPPVRQAEFTGTNVVAREEGDRSGVIDLTNISQGYIGIKCTSPVEARVSVYQGDQSLKDAYTYDITVDGTPQFYPLSQGSGQYTVILFIYLRDTPAGPTYDRFLFTQVDVTIADEFAPFLVQNQIVNYDENSQCVQLSHELTQHCKTDLEVVQQVYAWIAKNISYDTDKANELGGYSATFYTPNPDDTLRSKTGICYDYASLAAAMLRVNGIPTKLVKGDVRAPGGGGNVYHAWNLVWLEEEGWIAVQLPTSPGDWTRIDTTFAASGGDMGSFIGDGENYTALTYH